MPRFRRGDTSYDVAVNRAKIYHWAIVGLTAVALTLSMQGDIKAVPLAVFAFWVLLLVAVELLPVSLGFGTVTMGLPIYLAVSLLFQPGLP